MLNNIKAVLFDLDGTLIDSMWVWKQIDIDYLSPKNLEMPTDLQRKIEGMSMLETAKYFQKYFGITDDLETMMQIWNRMAMDTYSSQVNYKNGAEDFLKYLKKHNIKTGIATSNSRELLQAVTSHLSLDKYIDCFLTGNEVAHGKPWPDIYLEVAKRLHVSPEQCLVFEDIIPGILSGKAAGMKVCAIYDDYSKDVIKEKQEQADFYINDYTEIQTEE